MTSYLNPYIGKSVLKNNSIKDSYILTIQYALDGLCFIIFDYNEQKFLALKHYIINDHEAPLESILLELQEREAWKLKEFSRINFLIDNSYSTFIPSQYYDIKLKSDYLRIQNIPHNTQIEVDTISIYDFFNIYPIENNITEVISNFCENVNIRHASSVLICSLIKNFSSRNPEIRAFVNVRNNYFELTVINNCNLILHNYFHYNTKEDFLYFILFTFEQLKIDNETIPMYFLGMIEEDSPIVKLSSKYIRNIRFFNRDNNFHYIKELYSIQYGHYYTLYNSVLCE